MTPERIVSIESRDARFPVESGASTNAVHSGSEYAFATTLLATASRMFGTGIAFTLGRGNELVCGAVKMLGASPVGREIEDPMANFGEVSPSSPSTHNCAGSDLTNSCFDLWAKIAVCPSRIAPRIPIDDDLAVQERRRERCDRLFHQR